MKFTAKHLTLEVEVTPINGEARTLSVPPLTSAQSAALMDRLVEEDRAFDKQNEGQAGKFIDRAKHYAAQLAAIYSTEANYWEDNFDSVTIADVKRYIIDELLGVKKKA